MLSDEIELTDERMEELANGTAPSDRPEIPMSEGEKPVSETPAAPATTPEEKFYEFAHKGKTIRANEADTLKWAAQGYDYPQQMQALNQQRQTWDAERNKWEQSWSPYRQVDDWAKSNPEAWNRIQESIRGGGTQPAARGEADPYAPKFQAVESQLKEQNQFIQTIVAERQAAQVKEQDQALDAEIKSIREKYPDLDFDRIDPATGKSLERQVLEHSHANGIKRFDTGFKDFYHDQLIARAEAKAKEGLSKAVQKQTKLGVLGESPTPKKGLSATQDVRNKSYSDLEREALEELGLGA